MLLRSALAGDQNTHAVQQFRCRIRSLGQKCIGGFVAIAPGVFGPDQTQTLYVHSIGNSSSHEVVGGPGSQKASHSCDGKGIDYIDACFGE